PHVADAVVEHLRLDRLDLDDVAHDRHDDRRRLALARNRQDDLRLGLAPHHLDRFTERQPLGGRGVDLDDQVARLDAGPGRRGVLDRGDHLDEAVLGADLDAQPAELALRADLEFPERVGVQVGRVRIEPRQHAADRLGDELAIGDRLDVVRLDCAEDLGELLELVQGEPGNLVPLRDRIDADTDQHAGESADANEAELPELALHLLSVRAARGRNGNLVAAGSRGGCDAEGACPGELAGTIAPAWRRRCRQYNGAGRGVGWLGMTGGVRPPVGPGPRGGGLSRRAQRALPWAATASLAASISAWSPR